MTEVMQLTPEQAEAFWPTLSPHISSALQHDHLDPVPLDELLRQVREGYAMVLVSHDESDLMSATVIQLFRTTSGENLVHVLATAGDRSEEWLPALIDKFREIGQAEGAAAVTMTGRPGWAKKLRRFGFKTDQVSMRLSI